MKFYKKGFTIIELLIVIAIIGILVGVAVPYYNDYIYDSRVSVLKQNLQTMRKVINQFRGDRGRGPFRVQVNNAGSPVHYPFSSDLTNGSELVAGAFFPDSTTRQTNINYLKSLPNFVDPTDGSNMISTISPTTDHTACFVDDGDGIFQIDTESAFIDEDRDLQYDDGEPVIYEGGGAIADGTAGTKLDYIEFEVTGADGTKY